MSRHKDNSRGVFGCEEFETRGNCPHCQRYDAVVLLEDCICKVRVISEHRPETFPKAEADQVIEQIKALAQQLGRLHLKRRGYNPSFTVREL